MCVAVVKAVAERDHRARIVPRDHRGEPRQRRSGVERRQQHAAPGVARTLFEMQVGDDNLCRLAARSGSVFAGHLEAGKRLAHRHQLDAVDVQVRGLAGDPENRLGDVLSGQLSIRDPEQVANFISAVGERFGRLDVLVNNAGGQFPQPALDYSVKGWNAVVDTNLNGTWWMMQTTAKRWVATGQPGTIVNIVADIWRGLPGIAHSCAARAEKRLTSPPLNT